MYGFVAPAQNGDGYLLCFVCGNCRYGVYGRLVVGETNLCKPCRGVFGRCEEGFGGVVVGTVVQDQFGGPFELF